MTPPKRNPTNSDIMAEIKSIKQTLNAYGDDITELKNWKIAVEAAKEAIKEMKASQPEQSLSNKALAAVVTVITILAGAIVAMTQQ